MYVLHQTVIVVLAFFIINIPITGLVQWLLLFVCVIAGTFVLYEIVRQVDALRFLFGMKRRPVVRPATATIAAISGRKDPR